jgi:hypothetical protein
MFGKTLSTMDDGRKSVVSGKSERERASGKRTIQREEKCSEQAACRAF